MTEPLSHQSCRLPTKGSTAGVQRTIAKPKSSSSDRAALTAAKKLDTQKAGFET
jgi:hypothetical protein